MTLLPPPRLELGGRSGFLMLVKTYPVPSRKYGETVCCAGIDVETREWRRIYPVNFRSLDQYRRFSKWQFIYAQWGLPSGDNRPESLRIREDTIKAGPVLPAGRGWPDRHEWLDPLVVPSLHVLIDRQQTDATSLGVFRPAAIERFVIRPADPWDPASQAELSQLSLDWTASAAPRGDLEAIPYDFLYRFRCDDTRCQGHEMEIFDWEVAQSYRAWRRRYGDPGWRPVMEKQYGQRLPALDLHLVVGTHHRWKNWMIVGLLYPPHAQVLETKRATRREGVGQGQPMTLPLFGFEAQEGDGPSDGEPEQR
jgi:hypothetical protein